MKIKLFSFIAICLITTKIAFSQWIQTEGPIGLTGISGILNNDDKLFIGTNCGLHSSDSISGRWDYLCDISLKAYAKKGDSLLVGTTAGIMVIDLSSRDIKPISYGRSLINLNINAISSADTCLYIGTAWFGFKKSKGFSDNWESFNDGLPYFIASGGFHAFNVYLIEHLSDVVFCVTPDGLFKTNVDHILWSPASSGILKEYMGQNPNNNIKFLKAIGETIFVGIENKLYSSSNKGNSWEEVYSFGSTVSSLHKFGNDYYVTTLGDGIHISNDKGVSWTNFNYGLSDLNVNTLNKIDTLLICGTSDGLYYKSGNNWIKNNQGIICSYIRSMAISSKEIVANDNDKVYSSMNGNSWNEITPNVTKRYFGSVATMGDTLLLSVQSDPPFIIYSRDDGHSWENLNHPVPFNRDDSYSIYTSNKRLYAYEDDIMYSTDDFGMDWWKQLSLSRPYCNNFNGFLVYNSIPFALTCGNAEVVRLNSSGNWVLSNNGLPTNLQLEYLTKTNDALYVNVHGKGLYVSKDAGNSWSFTSNKLDLNDVLDVSWGISSSAYKGRILFISTFNGVFYTVDYGQNWKSLNVGLINKYVTSIKIFNDTLFAGTNGNGVWKYDIKSILLLSNTGSNINQNHIRIYPNPATDFLNVQIDSGSKFELNIIDLMGRQILSKHNLLSGNVDLSNLQNGTYILILKSDKDVLTHKLVINR